MGWLRAINQKSNPQATELRLLKDELRRISEKLVSRESEPRSLGPADCYERDPARDREFSHRYSTVPDAVVESAARLCEATDGLIARLGGQTLIPGKMNSRLDLKIRDEIEVFAEEFNK